MGGRVSSDREPTLEEREATREATDALKTLLARIGDIFGVFDFSFFVAGAVCFGAVTFGLHVFGGSAGLTGPSKTEWSAAHICAAIVMCYVLGIVCFAAGTLRRCFHRPYDGLPSHLRDFGLEDRYDSFLSPGGRRTYERLYTRLWVEVRQSRDLAPSFNLLTRYWVMAAMCDGLGAAWAVWAAVWGVWWWSGRPVQPEGTILALVEAAFVAAALLCWREAQRYSKYQMYELVATLAHVYVPIPVPVPVSPPAAVHHDMGRPRARG
jgi:hypothetical protein